MPERSQPENNVPHFSVHRLRRRAAAGLGEDHAEQAEIDRLFVTTPEGSRPDPKIIDADDVARGFGLPDDQVRRIAQVVRETRANFSSKGAQQHIVAARGTLVDVMRTATPHIPSDVRQEVLRRAISYWKAQSPIDLGREPRMRYVIQKSGGGHKYIRREATGDPKRPWRYVYAEESQREVKGVEKLATDLRKKLWELKDSHEEADIEAFDTLRTKIRMGLKLVATLYEKITGRKLADRRQATGTGTPRGPQEGERKPRQVTQVGAMALMLLRVHKALSQLLDDSDEARKQAVEWKAQAAQEKAAAARAATPSRPERSEANLTAAGGVLWEAHGKRRVYFNSHLTGAPKWVKIWYDLDKKAWGYRGNWDAWRGQTPEQVESDLDDWLDQRIGGEQPATAKPEPAGVEDDLSTAAGIAAAADRFKAKIDGMHWSDKPTHYRILSDGTIQVVFPADEDENGEWRAERTQTLVDSKGKPIQGTSSVDLGRSFDLPRGPVNDIIGVRNKLILGETPKFGIPPETPAPSVVKPTATVSLSDFWSNSKHLLNAGLTLTGEDVGYTRAQFKGTLEQFRAAIANLEALRATWKGADLRSLNTAIQRLTLQADSLDPEVAAKREREWREREAAKAAERARAAEEAAKKIAAAAEEAKKEAPKPEPKPETSEERRARERAERLAKVRAERAEQLKRERRHQFINPKEGQTLTADGDKWVVTRTTQIGNRLTVYVKPGAGNRKTAPGVMHIDDRGRIDFSYGSTRKWVLDLKGGSSEPRRRQALWPDGLTDGTVLQSGSKTYMVNGGIEEWEGAEAATVYDVDTDSDAPGVLRQLVVPSDNAWPYFLVTKPGAEPYKQDISDIRRLAPSEVKKRPEPPREKVKGPSEPAPEGTPRGDADKATKTSEYLEEYVNDRESKFKNSGGDILGSARHRALVWKGALSSGDADADQMFTRKFLEKQEPIDLVTPVQQSKDGLQALRGLAMHFCMKKFPAKPSMPDWGYDDKASKAQHYESYYKAFQAVSKLVAEHAAKGVPSGADISSAQGLYNSLGIRELRDDLQKLYYDWPRGPYKDAGKEAIRKMVNAIRLSGGTSPLGQLNDFTKEVKRAYPEGHTVDDVKAHALDILGGKSVNASFGTVKKKDGKGFNVSAVYRNIEAKVRRTGPDATLKSPEKYEATFVDKHGGQYRVDRWQFGKSVTDAEREHHVQQMSAAAMDLTDALGLPPGMFGIRGRLSIAIGARGKGRALAHYEPDKKVINLTREKGTGTLAHEWGHAFDFMLNGATGGSDKGSAFERAYYGGSNDAVTEAMSRLHRSPEYQEVKKRIRASVVEGEGVPNKVAYWTSHEEMFARCFERYVDHKLREKGRVNTYLTYLPPAAELTGYWPTDAETKKLAPLFDAIFEGFKREPDLLKAMGFFTIPLQKAMNAEWGTGPSGSGGPGSRTDALPDFSIYYAPEWQGRRKREIEAQENRLAVMREKNRGFWGPAPERDPDLRYEPRGDEARYPQPTGPKLGIRQPTDRGPKGQVDRLKAPTKPYEREDEEREEREDEEDEDSRKKRPSRKLGVRRK